MDPGSRRILLVGLTGLFRRFGRVVFRLSGLRRGEMGLLLWVGWLGGEMWGEIMRGGFV